MKVNLEYFNKDYTYMTYHVIGKGIDREGFPTEVMLNNDPTASSCNPYSWGCRKSDLQTGHSFSSAEVAIQEAKYAAGSWGIKSVDMDSLELISIETHQAKTMKLISSLRLTDLVT